jgi:hypothetical protein
MSGIDEGIETVLSTPPRRLREEISRIHPAAGSAPSWLDDLARGKTAALRHLRQALRVYFRSAIEPHPHDRDLYLDGRGLVLIPYYFSLHHPVALADPRLRPVLTFPIRTESRLLAGGHAGGDHVTAPLGATRASILRSVIGGSTTTRLARLVGVAPPR